MRGVFLGFLHLIFQLFDFGFDSLLHVGVLGDDCVHLASELFFFGLHDCRAILPFQFLDFVVVFIEDHDAFLDGFDVFEELFIDGLIIVPNFILVVHGVSRPIFGQIIDYFPGQLLHGKFVPFSIRAVCLSFKISNNHPIIIVYSISHFGKLKMYSASLLFCSAKVTLSSFSDKHDIQAGKSISSSYFEASFYINEGITTT